VRGFVYFDGYDVEVDGGVPVEVQEKHNVSAQTVAAVRLEYHVSRKSRNNVFALRRDVDRDVSTLHRLNANRQSIEMTGVESRKLLP
jgi:hypothetical protein